MNKGDTREITPTITPVNGDVMELSWSSAIPSVATVTKLNSGKISIKALKTGTTAITCTAPVTGATATINLTVTNPNAITAISFTNYPVSSVTGTRAVTVRVGSTVTVSANITPSNADTSTLEWRTANDEYAKVVSYSGNSCTVRGIKKGNIQLICRDKETGKSDFLGIIVQ